MALSFRNVAKPLAGVAVLGAAALANYLVARRAERRHPPAGRFIKVDGVRLHLVEKGIGEPVILLHGNGGLIDDFAISGVLDLLAQDHRVIVFDRPGFGHSERPRTRIWTPEAQAALLVRALRVLNVRRPVVVGHSWGTLVALALALDRRTDPAAMVLLSGYYFPSLRADVPLLLWPAVPVVGDILRCTVAPLLSWLMAPSVIRKSFRPSPVSQSFRTKFPLGMALRPSQIRAMAAETALMIPAAARLHARHRDLKMPVVIIAGIQDRIVSTERQSEKLHARVPHSELHTIPGAGHMIHHIAPAQVADAIRTSAQAATAARRRRPSCLRRSPVQTAYYQTPSRRLPSPPRSSASA